MPLDFPSQIVKLPQVLSHLLLMLAIFPFPCAIRFPKSNRQSSTSPISSAFSGRYFCHTHVPLDFPSQIVKLPQVLSHLLCSGRYSAFSHFTSFSCCVSRCVSPGRRLQVLTVQTVLSSEAVGASSSKRLPGETQRVP